MILIDEIHSFVEFTNSKEKIWAVQEQWSMHQDRRNSNTGGLLLMIFQTKHLKNGTSIIYGFRDCDVKFQMVMTLEHNDDRLAVHGFLSVSTMNPFELMDLYKTLDKEFEEQYLECQVIAEHARFYKTFLSVVDAKPSKTFNGHECELLLIELHNGVNNFEFTTKD